MSTLKPLRLRPRATLALLALALAAALGGCGPGVGGTGTGDTTAALAHFGASPASICSGELAALVACQPAAGTAAPRPAAEPVFLADATAGVRVRLQEDSVEVVAACVPLEFRGQWGAVGGQAGRFYGYADPGSAPATLETQADGAGWLLTLRDAGGGVLLGPVAVTPTAALPTLPACP